MIQNKWVIIHLFLNHPSLSIHSWIEENEGGQECSSESELHISASQREKKINNNTGMWQLRGGSGEWFSFFVFIVFHQSVQKLGHKMYKRYR